VQLRSYIVHFQTAIQMLDFIRLPPDGWQYKLVVQGLQQVFSTTIFFGTRHHLHANPLVNPSRLHFVDHIGLWFIPNMGEVLELRIARRTPSLSARLQ
jgi:hypothetical protein